MKKWTEIKEAGINMRIISLLVLKIKRVQYAVEGTETVYIFK